jgi:hypothetical protein
MTTPYGTTTFRQNQNPMDVLFRMIEATDPVGGRERLAPHRKHGVRGDSAVE